MYFDIEKPKEYEFIFKLKDILEIFGFEKFYKKPKFDSRYGQNKISGPSAYIDLIEGSMVISKAYYYNELLFYYDDINYSQVYDLKEECCDIKIEDNLINLNIKKKADKCSFFILISKHKLFNNLKNLEYYFKEYFKGIENNSVINSYFIKANGTYTKLPYSIEPFTKEGYGYSLHHSSKKELIPFLRELRDRYFYDFIVNAIMQAFLYQKNDKGVFYTSYTSTWLKKDSGIIAPYIDTRLNETFNLMLIDFKKLCPQFEINDNTKKYCDFLIKQIHLNNVYKLGEGVFFPDYFKENLKNKTHTSLNHQLGIINLMFDTFKKTGKDKFLKTSKKMINFLDITKDMWINPENNDLFYGLKMKKNQIEMFGQDYIYVTLIDLLIVQKNLELNNFKHNQTIDKLINNKIKYLNKSEYSIFDPNAKFAPGESINSRKKALELYDDYLIQKSLYFNNL